MLSAKPWKLDGMFRLLAVVLLCLASVALTGKEKPADDSLLDLVLSSLLQDGPVLIVTAMVLRAYGKTWSEAFGFSRPPVYRAMLLGFLATLLFLPVGMFLQIFSIRVLTWFHFSIETQTAVEEFNKTVSWSKHAYLALFAIVIAPFAEEVLFRGAIYGGIKKLGFPRCALWGSAVFFAAIHGNPPIFIPLLVLGLVLAWLYEKTGNLLSSITAHATFNAINVMLLLFGDQVESWVHRHTRF